MYKIDWSKISDEKTFQRLVNHLFALECNSPGFIPSSPYIGADGGWDGYYDGLYPKEKKEGIYSIQSKWTTKNFEDAFEKLRKDIKDELDKAQRNNVDYLRIVTNAKLRTEQILELESLNKRKIKDLRVWHRENLTMRIEKQPWLRYYFFDYPQHPLLTPCEYYFSKKGVESHLTSFPSIETNDFEKYISKAKQFISLGGKLLIIHSPGGYGKSHLLREIAQNAYQVDPARQVWLINVGFRDIKDAIQEEIFNDREYLLIFDDADRCFESVKPLLNFLRKGDVDVKLVLSLRSSGIYLLERLLEEIKCSEVTEKIRITEWKKDDLIKLLRATTGKSKVKNEESIAVYYPNPYIIVWIGSQLKGKPIDDICLLKKRFIEDVNYEARQCLKGIIDKK